MIDRGCELAVVLPFRREDFVDTSVAFAGPHWVKRFDAVLARASQVSYATTEPYFGDDCLFSYATDVMHGQAVLRARELETDVTMLAVVDDGAAQHTGGTVTNVRRWEESGLPARIIDLRELRNRASRADAAAVVPPHVDATPDQHSAFRGRRAIVTMLFADVVGFSKLGEEHAPSFVSRFLGAVEAELKSAARPPRFANTWGDGLFIAFDDVTAGAEFALHLRDAIRSANWGSAGLPHIGIRIGMHTGPVFPIHDPVVGRTNFFGSHVNRAARVEPVAAPNSVFMTEQTASALLALREPRFACDYVGLVPLAKNYGESRVYRLRRNAEAE